jgi:4-amino-4-deoxy-L-arabinose transferase-like glycosyltransferase
MSSVIVTGRCHDGEGVGAEYVTRARLGTLAWSIALGGLFLLRLGAAPLFDVDEGAFSEATREMVASVDFGFTTLNGALRFDKPILVYWLQASSVGALGVVEAAFRLPSALCAWLWCLALAGFAWTRAGGRVALAAGTVLATSVGVLVIGRAATAIEVPRRCAARTSGSASACSRRAPSRS